MVLRLIQSDTYQLGFAITGGITFLGVWAFACFQWGFLVGLAIGWLPALIAGAIVGALWPILLALLVVLLLMMQLFPESL